MKVMLAAMLVFLAISNMAPIVFGAAKDSAALVGQGTGLPEEIASIAQLGVAGALVVVILLQQREKSEMRQQMNEWEKTRHADSERLNDTLIEMTRHCTETMNRRNAT